MTIYFSPLLAREGRRGECVLRCRIQARFATRNAFKGSLTSLKLICTIPSRITLHLLDLDLSLFPCPDGTQLIAGIGNRVLVYDAGDGDLLHALKGHKARLAAAAAAAAA